MVSVAKIDIIQSALQDSSVCLTDWAAENLDGVNLPTVDNTEIGPLLDLLYQSKPTNGYRSWIIVLPVYGKDSCYTTHWKLCNKESWDIQSFEHWYQIGCGRPV